MIHFVLRRLLTAALLVFITLTLIFILARLAPGDPLNQYYGPGNDPESIARLRHQFGWDRPIHVQYGRWMWNFIRGDFGVSLASNRAVSEVLGETIPRTLQLTFLAMLLEILFGLSLGVFMAVKRNTRWETILKAVFLCFYSIPTFYLAYLTIAIFSLKLGWLPAANMHSFYIDSSEPLARLGDRLRHLVLPVAVLALGSAAALARFARGSLLDVMRQEFIRTARAKGLSGWTVLWRHAFKNALAPVITVIGLSFPFLLGGSVVVEKVFAWPGMGALTVDAIFARDYPIILAASFVAACMVILGNFIADISYRLIDPRIKLLSVR